MRMQHRIRSPRAARFDEYSVAFVWEFSAQRMGRPAIALAHEQRTVKPSNCSAAASSSRLQMLALSSALSMHFGLRGGAREWHDCSLEIFYEAKLSGSAKSEREGICRNLIKPVWLIGLAMPYFHWTTFSGPLRSICREHYTIAWVVSSCAPF